MTVIRMVMSRASGGWSSSWTIAQHARQPTVLNRSTVETLIARLPHRQQHRITSGVAALRVGAAGEGVGGCESMNVVHYAGGRLPVSRHVRFDTHA
jgi:hypothetical protein